MPTILCICLCTYGHNHFSFQIQYCCCYYLGSFLWFSFCYLLDWSVSERQHSIISLAYEAVSFCMHGQLKPRRFWSKSANMKRLQLSISYNKIMKINSFILCVLLATVFGLICTKYKLKQTFGSFYSLPNIKKCLNDFHQIPSHNSDRYQEMQQMMWCKMMINLQVDNCSSLCVPLCSVCGSVNVQIIEMLPTRHNTFPYLFKTSYQSKSIIQKGYSLFWCNNHFCIIGHWRQNLLKVFILNIYTWN